MFKTLRYLNRVFLVAIGLFSVAAFITIHSLTRELTTVQAEFRENLSSIAFQMDYALLIFINDLDRFRVGDPDVDRNRLIDRLNVYWSRLETNTTGQIAQYYLPLPGAKETVQEANRLLESIEPDVLSLERSDVDTIERLKTSLRSLIGKTHDVTMASVMSQAEFRTRLYDLRIELLQKLLIFLVISLLLGFGVFATLWLERRQLDNLSRSLEERVRERTDDLRRTEMLFRSVIAAAPAEIFVGDAEGRFLMVNSAWENVQGLRESDVVGKTNYDIFPEAQAARYVGQDAEVLRFGKPIETETTQQLVHKQRITHTIKFPVLDADGTVVGVGGITSDVTEQRETEEHLRQVQKMEAVGQLTGGVAHDFNNLLAVIIGNTELLQKRLGPKDTALDAILRASTRGEELTQRLLAFSRQQPLIPQVVDLGALVSDMSELLTRTLGETIEIEVAAGSNLWYASADPGQLENAILNLALNARDAMPDGGKLTVECTNARLDQAYVAENPEASVGNYVVLAVSDEGSGMTAEVQAHAFEPFFTTKDVGQGSGLGLSMVYGFAKQSGGQVTIYSEEGKGTTVKLYLPRAEETGRREAASSREDVPRGGGEVILVIEDDSDVRTLAVHMLEDLEYRVIDVPDAAAARQILADGKPVNLVLSDVVLPGGTSGPEFAEQARATYPDLKIIFMSGYPAEAAKRNGFLGSDQVLLNKPFRRRELAEALRMALDRSPSE